MHEIIAPTSTAVPSLAARLNECATRVGGKRALAQSAGLSEAQLFRYINGDSDMTATRAMALAKAAGVEVGWLLTGEGEANKPILLKPEYPPFKPELLEQITQTLEELLIEYQTPLTPRQRAIGIRFIYEGLRQDELHHGQRSVDRALILEILEFFDHFRSSDTLTVFSTAWQYNHNTLPHDLAQRLNEAVSSGVALEYDGFNGRAFFKRVTTQVGTVGAQRLIKLAERAASLSKSPSILDIGCGNGRELSFLHKHFPHFSLKGIELSQQGIQMTHQLEATFALPKDCVVQGNFTNLPFQDSSFDLVNSRAALMCVPYIPECDVGAESVFREVSRVLKTRGFFEIITRQGLGRHYMPFSQSYTTDDIHRLAERHGFIVTQLTEIDFYAGLSAEMKKINTQAIRHTAHLHAILQKKA